MSSRYENPALTADAVWIRGDRVLLIRRGRPPFRGRWAFPGGFVEQRETVEAAVMRELREETGLRARPIALVGVYSGPDRDPRKPTTTIAFRMRGPGGLPRGRDDAAEAAWVPIRAARGLAFDHGRILRDAVRQVRRERRQRASRATPSRRGRRPRPLRPRPARATRRARRRPGG